MAARLGLRSVFTASTGLKLPVIGLGTFLSSDESELVKGLNAALELRYPLIDTANLYNNEHVIGNVLKEWFDNGKLRREDIFVTTKLPPQGINPKYVREFIEKSLKNLQLDYVDLYLVHHAVGFKYDADLMSQDPEKTLDPTTDHVAVWKEMEKLVDDGLAKHIGLSNFNVKQIQKVLDNCRIKPSNLQIELHLYQQSKEEQVFCKKNGILITSYATLGSGGVPEGFFVGANPYPLKDEEVEKIAKAHGKKPSQVLLRQMIQSGIAVIPKSSNPERLKENIDIFDFELSKAELLRLSVLDRGEDGRRFVLNVMMPHPQYPYRKV